MRPRLSSVNRFVALARVWRARARLQSGHAAVVARTKRYYASDRVSALTDGVFAVALTILVFDLTFPDPAPSEMVLSELIREDWHPFLGWLISSVILIRLWLIHHDTVAASSRISSSTVGINMLFLLTVALIPFTANIITVYDLNNPGSLQIFAAFTGLSSLVLGWFVYSAQNDQKESANGDRLWSPRALHHLLAVPIIAVVAIAATQLDPAIAALIWGVESVVVIVVLLTSGRVGDVDAVDDDVEKGAQP